MAKKKSTKKPTTSSPKQAAPEFNMAEEIRLVLASTPDMMGREVEAALREKFPKAKINPNSCGVAFSNARRKLGLGPTRAGSYSDVELDASVVFAAKRYVDRCGGDIGTAAAGLEQLAKLQHQ